MGNAALCVASPVYTLRDPSRVPPPRARVTNPKESLRSRVLCLGPDILRRGLILLVGDFYVRSVTNMAGLLWLVTFQLFHEAKQLDENKDIALHN